MLTGWRGSRSFRLGRLGCWSCGSGRWSSSRGALLLGLLLEDTPQLALQVVKSIECYCGTTRQLSLLPKITNEMRIDLRTPGILAVEVKDVLE
jgi:hypothetical protein